jgi:rubrerythrin
VIDARTYAVLQDIVQRESRSLLQYVRESYPWITPEEQDVLAKIQAIIEEERQGAGELVRLLQRRKLPPPYVGSYPTSFTNFSFVSLDHMLPLLAANERQGIDQLQRDIQSVSDAEIKELLQGILDKKRQHLEVLQSLTAAHSGSAVT